MQNAERAFRFLSHKRRKIEILKRRARFAEAWLFI